MFGKRKDGSKSIPELEAEEKKKPAKAKKKKPEAKPEPVKEEKPETKPEAEVEVEQPSEPLTKNKADAASIRIEQAKQRIWQDLRDSIDIKGLAAMTIEKGREEIEAACTEIVRYRNLDLTPKEVSHQLFPHLLKL